MMGRAGRTRVAFSHMNRILRISLAATLVGVPAGVATAHTATARDDQAAKSDPARDKGTNGTFEASGTGSVAINGRQTSYGRFAGRLTVRVPTGTATVRIQGVPQKLTRVGTNRILTFTMRTTAMRTFYVRGANVQVQIVAPAKRKLSVSTFGVVRVALRGTGTYRVNSGGATNWPSETHAVRVRPLISRLLPAENTPA